VPFPSATPTAALRALPGDRAPPAADRSDGLSRLCRDLFVALQRALRLGHGTRLLRRQLGLRGTKRFDVGDGPRPVHRERQHERNREAAAPALRRERHPRIVRILRTVRQGNNVP
jgi:hypothetical protein